MKRVTKKVALRVAEELGVNLEVVGLKQWMMGMKVELEHGTVCSQTNVTGDNWIITGKIALAHLVEFPDYYWRLKVMEDTAESFWADRDKPSPLLHGECHIE